ncbi:MAG: hypothetical protein J6Z02_08345 [Lachnospiraceae bacterium]|nr:hypothetical protein [Lachnospiraceae bacterium]
MKKVLLRTRIACALCAVMVAFAAVGALGIPQSVKASDNIIRGVDKNKVTYKALKNIENPGTLTSESRASGILSDFSASNGETCLNHQNGIASDGKVFVICDTWNNRVLIYNTLPDENTKPDVVIGQKDFKHFDGGNGLDELNWPVSATFAGKKLLIADTHNNRILVYNKVPTRNGATADAEITLASETAEISWPWAVWSDGKKLVVTATMKGKIAFWNDLNDAIEGKYASFIIETKGTPRTIVTDGTFLLVGDHNMNGGGQSGSHVWKTFPTSASDKPDFDIDMQYGGAIIKGNFYGINNDSHIYVYDGVIDSAKEKPKTVIGNDDDYLQCGDYNQLVYAGKKTYFSCYNSSYVAIYDGVITKKKYDSPKGFIGADKKIRSVSVANGIYQNPTTATNGKNFVVADDYNRLLCIYKKIPKTNNVKADVVYRFGVAEYPLDVEIDSTGKLYVLTAFSLLVWDSVPLKGETYTKRYELGTRIGNLGAKLAVDDKFVFITSENDDTVYKFKKSAKSFKLTNATLKAKIGRTRNIFSNGKYLISANEQENKVSVYKVKDLSLYGEIKGEGFDPYKQFSMPGSAIVTTEGKLVIADPGYDRVLLYDSVDAAIKDFYSYTQIGLLDNYPVVSYSDNGFENTEYPGVSTDGSLFMPTNLMYYGGHLWVGEFKFCSRILRYDFTE